MHKCRVCLPLQSPCSPSAAELQRHWEAGEHGGKTFRGVEKKKREFETRQITEGLQGSAAAVAAGGGKS
jgi:hypothetical protein